MNEEIEELKKRIQELEKRPVYIPYFPPIPYAPPTIARPPDPFHYHGMTPCYQNPCYWC